MLVFDLFDYSHSTAGENLKNLLFPYDALQNIDELIYFLGRGFVKTEYRQILPNVWLHKSASVASSAVLQGPCVIGEECEVRTGAFVRGNVIVGKECVIGNSTELKNCILFDNVQVPHFNYVGDSILGYKAHLGAGVIVSNLKSDKSAVKIHCEGRTIDTKLRKFGALVGDYAEIGCNSVLNPGTIIGRNSTVYPLSSVRGYLPPNSIYKGADNIVQKE